MPPAKEELYRGCMGCDGEIGPVEVGGTWYPDLPRWNSRTACGSLVKSSEGQIERNEKVKKATSDGRDLDYGFAASTILAHTPPSVTHVFCPQYRPSGAPGGRFPAAFQDALASYIYLTRTLGIPTKRLILSGDSADGHMAIQLLRYLHEYGKQLGLSQPKAAGLSSLWCDVQSACPDPTIVYRAPQYATNFLPSHHLIEWAADMYPPRASTGVALDNPYVSPLGYPFKLPCLVFAMVGGVELNVKEVTAWCKEMRGVHENEVALYIEEDAPHDVLKCGGLLGYEDEAAGAVREASGFVWG